MKALFRVPKDAAKSKKKAQKRGLKNDANEAANPMLPRFWRVLKQRRRFASGLLRTSANQRCL